VELGLPSPPSPPGRRIYTPQSNSFQPRFFLPLPQRPHQLPIISPSVRHCARFGRTQSWPHQSELLTLPSHQPTTELGQLQSAPGRICRRANGCRWGRYESAHWQAKVPPSSRKRSRVVHERLWGARSSPTDRASSVNALSSGPVFPVLGDGYGGVFNVSMFFDERVRGCPFRPYPKRRRRPLGDPLRRRPRWYPDPRKAVRH